MSGAARPATGIRYEIGAATLADGSRVVNCWEVWTGGFDIPHRFTPGDPEQVARLALWVLTRGRRCYWRDLGGEVTGGDVLRVFGVRGASARP